jgi:hypothetical protein
MPRRWRFPSVLAVVASLAGAGGCVRTKPPVMSPARAESCRTATVRWFSPTDTRDLERLNEWCAGVGPPVVRLIPPTIAAGVEPANPAGTPMSVEDVVFVSWNVHVGNGDLHAFVRDLRAGVLTGGKPVNHFVLMLQETVRGGDVPAYAAGASGARRIAARNPNSIDIVDLSRDLGLSLIYVPSMRNGHSADLAATDRGSALLATMPLGDPVAVELPGERQRRVAIFAKLLFPLERASPMSVGVVHLDALGAPQRFWIFGTSSIRDRQVKAVAPLMTEPNLVLGADLNTWHGPQEAAPRFLETLFGTRASIVRDRPGIRVLDYLFFRLAENLAAECTIAANDYGSDHHPLIGRIIP